LQPSDLQHLVVPSDPQLHPDGVRVAYVLTEIDLDQDRYDRTIRLWDGVRNRRFTAGPSDTSPRWSPDGAWLAFLRRTEDDDAHPQLYVARSDGGEAEVRTDLPLGVTDLAWSPDSTQVVVVGREWVPELADLDADERARVPKRITSLPYRSDTDGWTHQHRTSLWLVEVAGDSRPRCLTPGDLEQDAPVWRPDGAAIAFLSDPPDRVATEPHNQPMELDLATGAQRSLAPPGMWAAVDYDTDATVYLTGLSDPFDWPAPQAIWRVDGDDSAGPTLTCLTGALDRDVNPGSPPATPLGPCFVDGAIYTVLEGRGTTSVVRLDPEAPAVDGAVTEVIGGRRCVTGYAPRPDGSAIVFTATDPATPGELYWLENGSERCLTDLTHGQRRKLDIRPTERFTFDRDGADLDVWAVLPDGFDRAGDRSVPVLLMIHGGPTAQYGEYFFDEFQVGAGAGYLVVATNPRGSSGRGTDWCRAVVGAWAQEDSVDTLDLEAVVDAALDRYPQADPERVGIMGGSYGGYATARLLARTDRYASAIVERGLLQWESFGGTSDIGPYFDRMFLGTSLADGAQTHRDASPLGTADRITTPTLILHSEHDWRCPIEQGEQLFVALMRNGTVTEMVRFPDEGHELTRSGSPKHRVERLDIVNDWHDRFLMADDT
jgi:dipeptidyl aminopeptidase/acylaminoacyl peptidase